MPLFAHLAVLARLRWIDSNRRSGGQRLEIPIEGIGTDGFDDGGELMPQDHWRHTLAVSDVGIVVVVQVAAADPRNLHAQQNLARSGRTRQGHALDAQILRSV
jgi:hypothetical protein